MSDTISSAVEVPSPYELEDSEEDRETLTTTLFRCIDQCDDADECRHLRDQVISVNMPVAESLARRYFGHGENNDDLRQVAFLGLTKAVAGYDSSRGQHFLAYAIPTITGELKKHFRDRCWSVRPPRRVQNLQREITAAQERLVQQGHRQPTVDEIADELHLPKEEVIEAVTAQGCFTPTSLDVPLKSDTATTFGDLIGDDGREFERSEARMSLAPLVKELPEDDRRILAMRFFEEQTQEQIAKVLGTSQMQISRRLSRLMGQLRNRIEDDDRCA